MGGQLKGPREWGLVGDGDAKKRQELFRVPGETRPAGGGTVRDWTSQVLALSS